jgi:hypothetical protein
MICDFCSAENPTRKYDCLPFLMDNLLGFEQWSDSAWAACDPCAALIDAGAWEVLIDKVTATFPISFTPAACREYRRYLRGIYAKLKTAMGQTA